VAAQLAESRLEPDRDVEQIAVADRMLHRARVTQRPDVRGEPDHGVAERVVDAQAFDRGAPRGHLLELAPAHALADGDRESLANGAALVDVARLDRADPDDVGAKLDSLVLEMARRVVGGAELSPVAGDRAVEARLLFLADPPQEIVHLVDGDGAAADGRVPFLPGEGRRLQRTHADGLRPLPSTHS
jgi:hypothetical protein